MFLWNLMVNTFRFFEIGLGIYLLQFVNLNRLYGYVN